MAIQIRSSLPVLLASLLIVSIATVAETTPQSISERHPYNLEPEIWEYVLEMVSIKGPHVLGLNSTPYRSEGVLEACGYEYHVVLEDWTNRLVQPVIVSGSVLYNRGQDQALYVSLKVGLTDIEEIDGRLWQTDAPVNYAYLRYGSHSTAGTEDLNIEGGEGSRIVGYTDRGEGSKRGPAQAMVQWVFLGPLTIAFNRQPKGLDLEFDLSVMDFPEVQGDMLACLKEMANQ